MSKFRIAADLVKEKFDSMAKEGKLFYIETSQPLDEIYMKGFLKKDDPVFRDPSSSQHNCNTDRHFIRRYGNIVKPLRNEDGTYELETMWDIYKGFDEDNPYHRPFKAMSEALKSGSIKSVFREEFSYLDSIEVLTKLNKNQKTFRIGVKENHKIYTKEEAEQYGRVEAGKVYKFNHFYADLPSEFIITQESVASVVGSYVSSFSVLKRALDEIPQDVVELVTELINQNSLLNGESYLSMLTSFVELKLVYDTVEDSSKELFLWNNIDNYKHVAPFRNSLIGTLCVELSEGKDLEKACKDWNIRVDPVNYMKAQKPITNSQIRMAEEFVVENGYLNSFNRRFAVKDDITADEILHLNRDLEKKTVTIFETIKKPEEVKGKIDFDKLPTIGIEEFMSNTLPTVDSVEVLFENKHINNLVALTTSVDKESKGMFMWNNNLSWTYNGNLAGKSLIRDAVKKRGGNIEAQFRVSLYFPNTTDDYDLHIQETGGSHIYYGNLRKRNPSTGMLDLDAQGVDGPQPEDKRVENITYSDISKLPNGVHYVDVNNYDMNGLKVPFQIEVETQNGSTILLESLPTSKNTIRVMKFYNVDGEIICQVDVTVAKILSSETKSKNVWNLDTMSFHPVNLISTTPNYWGDNKVGNKHFLFMLENCKPEHKLRSFHNENLNSELKKHRKVIDTLGYTTMVEPVDNQLAGLGFNSTIEDEVIVRLNIKEKKQLLKIKF